MSQYSLAEFVSKTSEKDRREQLVVLTDYGEKFRFALQRVIEKQESLYLDKLGEVEMDRLLHVLENLHDKLSVENEESKQQQLL